MEAGHPGSHCWFRGHAAGFPLVLLHLKVKHLEREKGGAWGKGPVVPQSAQPMDSPAENTAAIFYADDTPGPAPSMNLSTQICSFHQAENHKVKA